MVLCGECGKREATHVLHAPGGDFTACEEHRRSLMRYGSMRQVHRIKPGERLNVPDF